MKINQLQGAQMIGAYTNLPGELQMKLKDMTLNDALAKKLIDDIGDEDGNLTGEEDNDYGRKFAIIQGHKVLLSRELQDWSEEQIVENAGLLTFHSGVSTVEFLADGKTPNPGFGK